MQANESLRDVLIVGGGPVGLFAAFYAGLRGLSVRVIEALEQLGGQLVTLYPEKYIYDVAGFPKIKAKDLVANLITQAQTFQPEFVLGERAEELRRLNDGTYEVRTPKGVHHGRAVIITTGVGAFKPNTLDRPGVKEYEGRGVFYFVRNPEDFRGKRVLVVGGGDSAVDWALSLEPIARKVTLIHRREGFRAHEASVQALFASGVTVKTHYELKEVRGDGQRVTEVVIFQNQTGEEETLPVDAVILALGFKSDPGAVKRWGLAFEGRYIKVNPRMETNLPGVFAAGDAVFVEGMGNLKLLAVGFGQAAIAVNSAKTFLDPSARFMPGHSSSMDLSQKAR